MLFLHGVGGGAWSFAPQREAMRPDHRCFTWEGRGHGAAARVEDAGLADYHHDAEEALAHVIAVTSRPVLLVAHSMGALIALALACQRPAEVAGLFLVDPVYAEQGSPPRPLPRWLLSPLRALAGVMARSYLRDGWLSRFISRRFYRWAFHDRAARERAWIAQRTQQPLEYPRMLYEAVEGVTGFPFSPFADRITCPTVLVEALPRRAAPSRFAAVVRRLRDRLGDRFHHQSIEGGHYLQLDRPAEVNQRLREFAGRIRSTVSPTG